MNKFQKIAVQMAKDDEKKERELGMFLGTRFFEGGRNYYYRSFKNDKWPLQKAIDFKNWNKKIIY